MLMKPRTMTTSIPGLLLMGLLAVLTAACASKLEPARQAIASVGSALDATGDDPKRYVPEKYNEALGKLNAMKMAFNRKDYQDVLDGVPAAMAAVQALPAAAAIGKEEYLKRAAVEWTTLSVLVPKLLSAVEIRGEALERSKKPPEGVDLPLARRAIVDGRNMWTQAKASAERGRVDSAVDTAKIAKRRCEQAAKALKMELPSA
jgi:hypothetical protein